MSRILYYSSNQSAPHLSFAEALLAGQAPDQGLYIPMVIPAFSKKEMDSFSDMTYPEIAVSVLWKFLEGEIEYDLLVEFCKEAYDFDIPIENAGEGLHILRLDHGSTASFKDFAARIMSRLFNYVLEKEGGEVTILTATSGDTGSAIANAYHGMKKIKVVVLYPRDEVSELQRKQMTTMGENIRVLAVDGKFDDCQALVKKAFYDDDLKDTRLSSANSINIGRLLPQAVYYFYAWSRLAKSGERVVFSVPSGNFGNLVGGILAERMGLPVEKFIVSVNENDEFPLFMESGRYQKVDPSRSCLSSAMNVGHPSNLTRLIDLYGGYMDEAGRLVRMPDMQLIRQDLVSYSVSDKLTREIIGDAYRKFNILLEPHGAVAWGGYLAFLSNNAPLSDFPVVILETAHPAKFSDLVFECTGALPPMPSSLEGISRREESFIEIKADYSAFKNYLIRENG